MGVGHRRITWSYMVLGFFSTTPVRLDTYLKVSVLYTRILCYLLIILFISQVENMSIFCLLQKLKYLLRVQVLKGKHKCLHTVFF